MMKAGDKLQQTFIIGGEKVTVECTYGRDIPVCQCADGAHEPD